MKRRFGIIGLWIPMVLCLIWAGEASAWWNEQWQYRQKISFDTTSTGADIKTNLTDVPVLIRLHSGNFNFGDAIESGEDIRFVSADDQLLLKGHIEKFDPIDEVAYVWIKLPKLSGAGNQDFCWMYYGHKAAVGGQDSGGTFDTGHVAVYHLGEPEATPKDATAHNQHAAVFQGGQGLPSVIGNGVTLNGGGDRLVVTATPAISFSEGFTFSTWLRINQPQQAATLFARTNEQGAGILIQIEGTKACFQITADDGQVFRTSECLDLALESWHHVAFTAQAKGRMATYMDGLELFYLNLPIDLPQLSSDLFIGAMPDGSGSFMGDLDEIQISTQERSADWIRAAFKSQGPDALLAQAGTQEVNSGGFGNEFIITTVQVVKNITLDGWMIIGCLGVMLGASLVIFLNKMVSLRTAAVQNRQFATSFRSMPDPVAGYDQANNSLSGSNLYRIYAHGCESIKELETGGTPGQGALLIKGFKASLEQGFMEESKRLNAGLLMLTMSITGGPFLGLLGTVWGVMSTFAAMAEAGEANIAAIAPGIASALATTVVGLLVAIPALFAYNYLLSRVKLISAELIVFIDQFSIKMERLKGGTL